MARRIGLLLGLAVLSSCGDDPPPDVAGAYAVTVATDDDGCALDGLTAGAVTITLTQDADDPSIVAAEVDGAIAPFMGITVGGTDFTGTLDGSTVTVSRDGAQRQTGGCTYRVDADIEAVVSGEALSGTLTYTARTNDNVDCVLVDGCTTTQTF